MELDRGDVREGQWGTSSTSRTREPCPVLPVLDDLSRIESPLLDEGPEETVVIDSVAEVTVEIDSAEMDSSSSSPLDSEDSRSDTRIHAATYFYFDITLLNEGRIFCLNHLL